MHIFPQVEDASNLKQSTLSLYFTDALANHGILPHDGRRISMAMFRQVFQDCLNMSRTNTLQSTIGVSLVFGGRDVLDLGYVLLTRLSIYLSCRISLDED